MPVASTTCQRASCGLEPAQARPPSERSSCGTVYAASQMQAARPQAGASRGAIHWPLASCHVRASHKPLKATRRCSAPKAPRRLSRSTAQKRSPLAPLLVASPRSDNPSQCRPRVAHISQSIQAQAARAATRQRPAKPVSGASKSHRQRKAAAVQSAPSTRPTGAKKGMAALSESAVQQGRGGTRRVKKARAS